MGCNDFSAANVKNRVHDCKKLKASLWLRHTQEYNYINAYNLAVMSTLAYSRVQPPKGQNKTVGDVADFYTKCFQKFPFSSIKKEADGVMTSIKPFYRYDETEDEETPLIEKHDDWFVDTADYFGNSTEAFFFVDDENAVLSVRGTSEMFMDIGVIDMNAQPTKLTDYGIKGYMHHGFTEQAKTIIENKEFRKNFIPAAKGKKLFVTGHSLGGAVATILAAYLKVQELEPLLYTYGSPRVGDDTFVKEYSSIKHYRHVYHKA